MKKYKVRLNCTSYVEVVVQANNKQQAIDEALRVAPPCQDTGLEFSEFLDVEDSEQVEN